MMGSRKDRQQPDGFTVVSNRLLVFRQILMGVTAMSPYTGLRCVESKGLIVLRYRVDVTHSRVMNRR